MRRGAAPVARRQFVIADLSGAGLPVDGRVAAVGCVDIRPAPDAQAFPIPKKLVDAIGGLRRKVRRILPAAQIGGVDIAPLRNPAADRLRPGEHRLVRTVCAGVRAVGNRAAFCSRMCHAQHLGAPRIAALEQHPVAGLQVQAVDFGDRGEGRCGREAVVAVIALAAGDVVGAGGGASGAGL